MEKSQRLGSIFTQAEGYEDGAEVSDPSPSLWSCVQVCWVAGVLHVALIFPPELHLFYRYCRHCCGFSSLPASLPQRECSFSPRYQSVAISETLCTVIKVTFMLCSMLKGSVHHVKTYSIDGLAPLGLKESWRIAMTMNASPTGRGNKRCLNEFLMDCCKMTVRALLMPCGIISPECQCF